MQLPASHRSWLALISIAIVAVFLAAFVGSSSHVLRGSLTDDAVLVLADFDHDGHLSTKEVRTTLIAGITAIAMQNTDYDFDQSGTVNRADLMTLIQSLRTFMTTGCGNGSVDGAEECDDGNRVDTDWCTNVCTIARCGDGIAGPREECDDGNAIETDSCTSLCKAPFCGDGFMQGSEACDDGNNTDTDSCKSCKKAVCGDGFRQDPEQCDDGNTTDGDVCSSACMLEPSGGLQAYAEDSRIRLVWGFGGIYGQVWDETMHQYVLPVLRSASSNGPWQTVYLYYVYRGSGREGGAQWDNFDSTNIIGGKTYYYDVGGPYNPEPGLGNRTMITAAYCGDGLMNRLSEMCDDGNRVDNDACSNQCTLTGCGDGVQQMNEECDDGNLVNTDDCDNFCVAVTPYSWLSSTSATGKLMMSQIGINPRPAVFLAMEDGTSFVLTSSVTGLNLQKYLGETVTVHGFKKHSLDYGFTIMNVTKFDVMPYSL